MHPKMSFGARSTMCVRASNAALAIANSSLPPLSVPVVARQSLTNGFLHGVLRSSLQLPRYPKMVEGVVACDVYSKKKEGAVDVTCATYKLKSAGFSMQCVCQQRLSPTCPTQHYPVTQLVAAFCAGSRTYPPRDQAQMGHNLTVPCPCVLPALEGIT